MSETVSVRFDVLHAYAEANRLDFNDLCRTVRDAIAEGSQSCAADAARYRFLRDHKAYVAVQPHYKDLPKSQRTGWTVRLVTGNDESFDAAIDAAILERRG